MKTGLFLAALVQLTSAQPHNNRHAHLHGKREPVIVTQVQTVTATAPDAVVFLNQQGVPYSTSYCTESGPKATPQVYTSVVPQAAAAAATPAAAPAPAVKAPVAPAPAPAPEHHHHHKHHKGGHSNNAASAVSSTSGSPGKAGLSSLSKNIGIVYSPYNSDNSCKTQQQVNSDFEKINGYSSVRLYGVDCNQVSTVSNAAKAKNMNLYLGVYDLSDVSGDLSTMHSGLGGDWSRVDTVAIGNELVNSGEASASEVAAAVSSAKGTLSGLGYSGPVVTVDTFNAILANKELCQASDYVAANAHAFFDPDCPASNAGTWTTNTAKQLQSACGKPVIITECGWPHQGIANGAAVPGVAQQQQAISSLKSAFATGGMILFTAFDDLWKTNSPATFDAEQYWGILPGQ